MLKLPSIEYLKTAFEVLVTRCKCKLLSKITPISPTINEKLFKSINVSIIINNLQCTYRSKCDLLREKMR